MARAAALPPSRPSPALPLLPLLLLLLREAGAQNGRVSMPPEVRGRLGDTVELPCHLLSPGPKGNVSQVTWQRLDPSGNSQSVAAFHPSHGLSFPSPQFGKDRLSFRTMGQSPGARQGSEMRDATLVLQDLRVEDEGNFSCEFATFPLGTSRGVTWLRTIAQPQNRAEAQEVTLRSEPVPVALCVSSGGRPPAKISWLSPLRGEPKESETAGPLAGTVTVTSRYAVVPSSQVDGVQITCKVEHEAMKEPDLMPVTLSVRYPPEVSISGYDDNWYLGRSEATLNCDVRSKPEPTGYVWTTTSGSLPASAKEQDSQLMVPLVDRLVNTTFICTVSNAVGTGRAEQVVLVRESPNTAGAGATGGIIGGIIATIIATAVVATGILICRQQRKEQRLQVAEEEDDLEGPPSYKPPTPKTKLEEPEMEMPRYHELPTLEERSGPLLLGAMSLGSPILVPPGPPVVERVPLDLEDMDDDEEDYLDKINPIYDALSYASPSDSYPGKGFVMSRAMYV
ncbi:nectin-2 isoform X4 [Myotis myotis]|uniref:nectin-2 isoform X4 n=1 Tax=Myotis myotis TaxID=51298 RepID=UPI00174818C8|nr:nectin-2 isoform X4 [Myotis myotis]